MIEKQVYRSFKSNSTTRCETLLSHLTRFNTRQQVPLPKDTTCFMIASGGGVDNSGEFMGWLYFGKAKREEQRRGKAAFEKGQAAAAEYPSGEDRLAGLSWC
jgi:hypothetical protein